VFPRSWALHPWGLRHHGEGGFGSTMRCEGVNDPLRSLALYILATQFGHEVGMLAQDPALERGRALIPAHLAYVQGIGRRLVLALLQLTPVDELDISDCRSSRSSSIFVLEPGRAASTAGKSSPSAAAAPR
jgi:hypothetical protein